MKKKIFIALLVSSLLIQFSFFAPEALARDNSVIFLNQSGEEALVKLVCLGANTKSVSVPNGSQRTIYGLTSGTYYIKVRFGTAGNYHYAKGDQFDITASYPFYEVIEITLRPVVNGNYAIGPIGEAEFSR